MDHSTLLPPFTAVRLAWARTGKLSKDEYSQLADTLAEDTLKSIREQARGDPRESEYVLGALATLDAGFRSLEIIYKGRELNFRENEKLRLSYLETIKDNLNFGLKAKDVLKSIPAIVIGGAGGATLIHQALSLPADWVYWIGLAGSAVGYLLNMFIVRMSRHWTRYLYVKEDYDRNLYYQQYITRVVVTLTSMYRDIDRIHAAVFGGNYPTDRDPETIVKDMLRGVRPMSCPYIQKHMAARKITPKLWPVCESGFQDAVTQCPHWEGAS